MSLFEIILAVGLALTLLLTLKSLQVATKALKETGSIKPLALESVQLLMENGEEETLPLGTIALLPLQVEAFLMKAQASAWKNGGDWHSRHWRGREYEIEATFWKNKNWEVQLRMHNDANSKGFTLERNTGWQPSAERAMWRASETMLEMILRVGCMSQRALPEKIGSGDPISTV